MANIHPIKINKFYQKRLLIKQPFLFNFECMSENKNKNQLNIELTEDIADGVYSNLAIITHSNSEFVVDFARVLPGVPKAKVKSRIVLTPQHAKRLLRALSENVKKFEALHGNIQESEMQAMPMTFSGPTTEA